MPGRAPGGLLEENAKLKRLELDPARSYSTNLPNALGCDLGFLHRLDGFVTTAMMAAAIRASKSVSISGTCGVSWRWSDPC
jgi:hypothetical protein